MRIIAHKTIVEYGKRHPDAKIALDCWYKVLKSVSWKNYQDIIQTFNSLDFAGNQRYIFNIKQRQ
jgi:mRNA interferase HigB